MRTLILGALLVCGCVEPRDRPDVRCSDACTKRVTGCAPHECERGCAFVLDRLVEHEQDTVLRCMMTASKCDDPAWATCAVRVGPYADGGPGAPAHVPEEEL